MWSHHLSLDVLVLRRSQDPLRPQSHLRRIDKCLSLSLRIEGISLGISLRQLNLVHIPQIIILN